MSIAIVGAGDSSVQVDSHRKAGMVGEWEAARQCSTSVR